MFVLTHHPEDAPPADGVTFLSCHEIDLHIAPVLLGAGVRLFDNPSGTPVRRELVAGEDPAAVVSVRYHPNRRGQEGA